MTNQNNLWEEYVYTFNDDSDKWELATYVPVSSDPYISIKTGTTCHAMFESPIPLSQFNTIVQLKCNGKSLDGFPLGIVTNCTQKTNSNIFDVQLKNITSLLEHTKLTSVIKGIFRSGNMIRNPDQRTKQYRTLNDILTIILDDWIEKTKTSFEYDKYTSLIPTSSNDKTNKWGNEVYIPNTDQYYPTLMFSDISVIDACKKVIIDTANLNMWIKTELSATTSTSVIEYGYTRDPITFEEGEYFVSNKILEPNLVGPEVQGIKVLSNNDELIGYADVHGSPEMSSSVRTVAIYRIDGNFSQQELNALAARMLYERNHMGSYGYQLTFPYVTFKYKDGDYFDGLGDSTIKPPMPYRSGTDVDPAEDPRDAVWQITEIEIKHNTTVVTVNSTYKTIFELFKNNIKEVKSSNPTTEPDKHETGVIQLTKGMNNDIFQHDPLFIDASCTGDITFDININEAIQEAIGKPQNEGRFVEYTKQEACVEILPSMTHTISFYNMDNIPAKYQYGEIDVEYTFDCMENCGNDCLDGCERVYSDVFNTREEVASLKFYLTSAIYCTIGKHASYVDCEDCVAECGSDTICQSTNCFDGGPVTTCAEWIEALYEDCSAVFTLSLNTLNTIESKFNDLDSRVLHCLNKFGDLKEDGEEFVETYLEFSTKYLEKLEDSKYPSCNFNDCTTMVSDAKVYETLFDEMVIKIDEVNSLFFDYLSTASSATSSCDEASTTHCFECEYLHFIHDEIEHLYTIFDTYYDDLKSGVTAFKQNVIEVESSCLDCQNATTTCLSECMSDCGICLASCSFDIDTCLASATTPAQHADCLRQYSNYKQCLCECSDCSTTCTDYCEFMCSDFADIECMKPDSLCNGKLNTNYIKIREAYLNISNYIGDKITVNYDRVLFRHDDVYTPLHDGIEYITAITIPALRTKIINARTCASNPANDCSSLKAPLENDIEDLYERIGLLYVNVVDACSNSCDGDCEEFDLQVTSSFKPDPGSFPDWYHEDLVSLNLVENSESNLYYENLQNFTTRNHTMKIRSWPGAPPVVEDGMLPSMNIDVNFVNNKMYSPIMLNNLTITCRFHYMDDTPFLSNRREYSELHIGDTYDTTMSPATNGYPLYAYASGVQTKDIIKVYGYYLSDFSATLGNRGYQDVMPMTMVADYNTVKVFKGNWGINADDHEFYSKNKTDNRYHARILTPKTIIEDNKLYKTTVVPLNNINVPHCKIKVELKPTYRIDGITVDELASAASKIRYFNDIQPIENLTATFERKYLNPIYLETLGQTFKNNVTVIPRGMDESAFIRHAKIYINDYETPLDIYNGGSITFTENLVNSTDGVRCSDVFEFGSSRPNIINVYVGKRYDLEMNVTYNKYKNIHTYGEYDESAT